MAQVAHNGAEIEAWLQDIGRQAPFAASKGLNETVKDARALVRATQFSNFTIRNPRFALPVAAPRDDLSTRAKLVARVALGNGGAESIGARRAKVWSRHEEGGTQSARQYPLYIPSDLTRISPSTVIPRNMYPAALGLKDYRTPKGTFRAGRRMGKRDTFILPRTRGAGAKGAGIYRRINRDEVEPVWWFRESIRLRPRLRFHVTVNHAVDLRWAANTWDAIQLALRTAR